jgi:hypothetical protein
MCYRSALGTSGARRAPAARFTKAPEAPQTEDMSDQEQAEIRLEFARLKQEHTDFDAAINAMIATGCDPLQVQRMKKKKLVVKDRLKQVEDRIIPDIIA